MNATIYTGTLNGPHGEKVGRWVRQQDAHNLQSQIDILRECLAMVTQAQTIAEAVGIAEDAIKGHDTALAQMKALQ